MSLSLGGRLIHEPNGVSALGRLVLTLVDGGFPWLEWAVSHSSARYDFDDETQLMQAVQQGLHAGPLTLLPRLGLLVSPVKLMTLGLPALQLLLRAEQGDGSDEVASAVPRLLTTHGLRTQADFGAGLALLALLGVAGAPVFQTMSPIDLGALCDLHAQRAAPDAPAASLQREAAAFAVGLAQTPGEFVDYHRTYLALAADPTIATQAPDERAMRAKDVVHALLPLLFKTLDCPQLDGLPAPDQVARAVQDWFMQGKRIGFERLSHGVEQLVRHGDYRGETGLAANRLVDRYLDAAQSFLAARSVKRARMGQDGATCTYQLFSEQHQAQLLLSDQGVISLRAFGPRPDEHSTPAPATGVDHLEKESAT